MSRGPTTIPLNQRRLSRLRHRHGYRRLSTRHLSLSPPLDVVAYRVNGPGGDVGRVRRGPYSDQGGSSARSSIPIRASSSPRRRPSSTPPVDHQCVQHRREWHVEGAREGVAGTSDGGGVSRVEKSRRPLASGRDRADVARVRRDGQDPQVADQRQQVQRGGRPEPGNVHRPIQRGETRRGVGRRIRAAESRRRGSFPARFHPDHEP